jgi:hypothetical protein
LKMTRKTVVAASRPLYADAVRADAANDRHAAASADSGQVPNAVHGSVEGGTATNKS